MSVVAKAVPLDVGRQASERSVASRCRERRCLRSEMQARLPQRRALPVLSIRRRISCKASGVSASMRMAGSSTFNTLTSSRPCSSLRAPASARSVATSSEELPRKQHGIAPTTLASRNDRACVGLRLETGDQGIEHGRADERHVSKADQRRTRLLRQCGNPGDDGGGEPLDITLVSNRDEVEAGDRVGELLRFVPLTRTTGRAREASTASAVLRISGSPPTSAVSLFVPIRVERPAARMTAATLMSSAARRGAAVGS